jgi:hypothetical protein
MSQENRRLRRESCENPLDFLCLAEKMQSGVLARWPPRHLGAGGVSFEAGAERVGTGEQHQRREKPDHRHGEDGEPRLEKAAKPSCSDDGYDRRSEPHGEDAGDIPRVKVSTVRAAGPLSA